MHKIGNFKKFFACSTYFSLAAAIRRSLNLVVRAKLFAMLPHATQVFFAKYKHKNFAKILIMVFHILDQLQFRL